MSLAYIYIRRQSHIRRDERSQSREKIHAETDITVAPGSRAVRKVGNQCSASDAGIRLKRLTRVAEKEIEADVGHAEMNARNVIEVFDVRLAVKDIQLTPMAPLAGKYPSFPPYATAFLRSKSGARKLARLPVPWTFVSRSAKFTPTCPATYHSPLAGPAIANSEIAPAQIDP